MKKQEVEIPASVTLSEQELAQVSGGLHDIPLSRIREILKRLRLHVATVPSA
jgi:bacteriocin-like protein